MKDYNKVSLNNFTFPNDSESHIIRTVYFNGVINFVASDVAKALGYTNYSKAIKDHCKKKGITNRYPLQTIGGVQYFNLINEPNVYRLCMKSKLKSAEKFEVWVFEEVLPQIRKTGSYNAKPHLTKCLQRMLINVNGVDHGYFSVIQEMFQTIHLKLEALGYTIPDSALDGTELRPDVSVGLCFANFLKNYYPTLNSKHKKYTHYFLSGITVEARQYPDELLPLFREFANNVWIPQKAHNYFKDRDPKALEYLPKLLPSKRAQ
jgi:prophage antirepressor-like protein